MIIACPICDKSTHYHESNIYRPFCSERCKLIDLGEWASGSRTIAGEPLLAENLEQGLIDEHTDFK